MKSHLLALLAYERWANHQVLTALAATENPPARAAALMAHLLAAQQVWLARMEQRASPSVWPETPIRDMAVLVDANEEALCKFLDELLTDPVHTLVTYHTSRGEPFTNSVADIFTHLSHHAAYHRGQIIQLLRPLLPAVPQTDYIFYLRR
jgi:uncharacterized damage-inducible protein DinB